MGTRIHSFISTSLIILASASTAARCFRLFIYCFMAAASPTSTTWFFVVSLTRRWRWDCTWSIRSGLDFGLFSELQIHEFGVSFYRNDWWFHRVVAEINKKYFYFCFNSFLIFSKSFSRKNFVKLISRKKKNKYQPEMGWRDTGFVVHSFRRYLRPILWPMTYWIWRLIDIGVGGRRDIVLITIISNRGHWKDINQNT